MILSVESQYVSSNPFFFIIIFFLSFLSHICLYPLISLLYPLLFHDYLILNMITYPNRILY
jgi:hypothetical protein